MFYNAAAFNGDLSKWDVPRVIYTNGMFRNVAAFNGGLSKWDVSSVTGMDAMFYNGCYLGPVKGKQKRNVCRLIWVNITGSVHVSHTYLQTTRAHLLAEQLKNSSKKNARP